MQDETKPTMPEIPDLIDREQIIDEMGLLKWRPYMEDQFDKARSWADKINARHRERMQEVIRVREWLKEAAAVRVAVEHTEIQTVRAEIAKLREAYAKLQPFIAL